jgi:hypothetical protein
MLSFFITQILEEKPEKDLYFSHTCSTLLPKKLIFSSKKPVVQRYIYIVVISLPSLSIILNYSLFIVFFYFLSSNFTSLSFLFLSAHINYTKGFHCDISIQVSYITLHNCTVLYLLLDHALIPVPKFSLGSVSLLFI